MADYTSTAGDDNFKATSGADRFSFGENQGVDLIVNFTPGQDKLVYTDNSVDGFDDIGISQLSNGDTAVESNDQVTVLQGIRPDQLQDGDFVFTTSGPRYTIERARENNDVPDEVNVSNINQREASLADSPAGTGSDGGTGSGGSGGGSGGGTATGTVTISFSGGSFVDGSGDKATFSGSVTVNYDAGTVDGNFDVEGTDGNGFGNSGNFTGRALQQNGNQYTASGQGFSVIYTGQSPTQARFVLVANGNDTYDTNNNASGQRTYAVTSSGGARDTVCFCRGTMILTDKGEVAVERLAVGDTVVTASGAHRPIRWIGRRSYAGRFANSNPDVLPVRIEPGALADGVPARALSVSPRHALVLDGALIPAELLVNGVSVTQASRVDLVEYFHVELDGHDVLLAEGAQAESYVEDDNRGFFHNAAEFWAADPDRVPAEAAYCLPRLDQGFALEAIRRRIAARAGVGFGSVAPEPLRGFVEGVSGGVLSGWAFNEDRPESPVFLEVVVDGKVVAGGFAAAYRQDLAEAGLGGGAHAFSFALPDTLAGSGVTVRRAADGAALVNLPEAPRAAA